jgi:hypothetical protein
MMKTAYGWCPDPPCENPVSKKPYVSIDCSGLATSSRVMQLGEPRDIEIDDINVDILVANRDYTSLVDESEIARGDLCALSNSATRWSHVVIVQNAEWNPIRRTFVEFQGVEAIGEPFSEVRYFDDIDHINDFSRHQVLRWSN